MNKQSAEGKDKLIGYHDLEDVNTIIHDAESRLKTPDDSHRPLAKVMLVFMIRGLFTLLKYPYVQFPTASTKGADLFPLFRKVLSQLTRLGIRVMAVTCDDSSDNRRHLPLDQNNSELFSKREIMGMYFVIL